MTSTTIRPRMESRDAFLLAGLRRTHRMADAAQSLPQQWRDLGALGPVPGRVEGPAYGAYCSMDGGGFEYLTGTEVQSFEDLGSEFGRMRVPAQQYAVFTHDGPVSKIGDTWQSIWRDWLPASGYADAKTPPFELYGEDFDAEAGTGRVEIWFPVTPAPDR